MAPTVVKNGSFEVAASHNASPQSEERVELAIEDLVAEMELRKMQRRFGGTRENTGLFAPLALIFVIFLIPFAIFDMHYFSAPPCATDAGRVYPCSFDEICDWTTDTTFECDETRLENTSSLAAFNNASTTPYFASSVEDTSFLLLMLIFSGLLLFVTGGVWLWRWTLYSVAITFTALRFVQGLLIWGGCVQTETWCASAIAYFASSDGRGSGVVFLGPWPYVTTLALLAFVLVSSTYLKVVMPLAARHRWLRFSPQRIRRFYNIKPLRGDGDESGSYKFAYTPLGILPSLFVPALTSDWKCILPCCGKRHIFSYSGQLDSEGRPHGIGRWRDSQSKGESLKGLWKHGKPIGPFAASEQGSGFGFRSVQIAFATCDKEAFRWDENRGATMTVHPDGLHWGVASTETSISGSYYRHLPESTILKGPSAEGDADWAMRQMTQMRMEREEGAVTVSTFGRWRDGTPQLMIHGYEPMEGEGRSHPTRVTLEVVDPSEWTNAEYGPQSFRIVSENSVASEDSSKSAASSAEGSLVRIAQMTAEMRIAQMRAGSGGVSEASSASNASFVSATSEVGVEIGVNEEASTPPPSPPPSPPSSEYPSTSANDAVAEAQQALAEAQATLADRQASVRRRDAEGKPTVSFALLSPVGQTDAKGGGAVFDRRAKLAALHKPLASTASMMPDSGRPSDSLRTLDEESNASTEASQSQSQQQQANHAARYTQHIWQRSESDGGASSASYDDGLPYLNVLGWRPRTRADALVFIHGWTAGHKNTHLQLAQFLNLSRLDPHVKPFIFGWPCGSSPLSFPQVAKFASTSKETHEALATFFQSLAAAGIQRVHVFAHSMGARLFCSALPKVLPLFKPLEDHPTSSSSHEGGGAPQLKLSTLTLLHPEHDLHTFIERDYPDVRNVCEVITLYMDRSDQALAWAEVFNKAPSLGKHPFALVSNARTPQATAGGASPPPPATGGGNNNAPKKGRFHLPRASVLKTTSVVKQLRGYDREVDLTFAPTAKTPALDLDVIDTSWMDTNTVGPRHSYFNVNRWLIDDLAEIIVTRRRASSRPHRLVKLDMEGRTFGNVWVFLAAPSWIGS